MKETIIEFRDYGWQYNAQSEPTLHNIDLEIHKGEKILICGASGSGKSTLGNCLNGLIPFSYRGTSTGSLLIGGKEASEMSIFEISKIVGTVLQDSDCQFVGLTVAEDIAFSMENDCVPQEQLFERVMRAAKQVEVEDLLSQAPTDLSGGQKQRVSLAGVMVDNVPVLLFDEPLANLDPATGKQAIELIDRIQKEQGATVIIIEHRLEDVLHRDIDRIILMDDGRIVADTTPDMLLSTSLLEEHGIREPLYITALKHAGVKITEEMHPHSIRTIVLNEEQKSLVRKWSDASPDASEQSERSVILEAQDISFGYNEERTVLKDISLRVYEGEMMAIVGRNGAGKSTFSKLVCGFIDPLKGRISFCGDDLSAYSIKERADRIGYVMQNPNQMISKTMIFDEVALGLRTRGVDEETVARKVNDALKVCGLYPFRNWPVSALSFGQKKRVTVAAMLVLDPRILILDEPTAGQDFRHYTEIMEFLKGLNASGLTVIMITHDMHLMQEYCQRAVVFSGGELIADDLSAKVLTDEEIIEKASLKRTSLFDLALACDIEDPYTFVRRFIDLDREVRN